MNSAWIGLLGVALGALATSGTTIFMNYSQDKRKRKEKRLDEIEAMKKDELSIYNDVIQAYGEYPLIEEVPDGFLFKETTYRQHIRPKFFKNIYLIDPSIKVLFDKLDNIIMHQIDIDKYGELAVNSYKNRQRDMAETYSELIREIQKQKK